MGESPDCLLLSWTVSENLNMSAGAYNYNRKSNRGSLMILTIQLLLPLSGHIKEEVYSAKNFTTKADTPAVII